MLKKQIVVIALALLSGTLCIAVPQHTREERSKAAKQALDNRRLAWTKDPLYKTETKKEEAAKSILAEPHLKNEYRAKLEAALNKLTTRAPSDDIFELVKPIDELLADRIDDIFEYNPGFISDFSDAVDWFPALTTDAMNESRTLRIALVYSVTAYGIYRLYTFFTKASHAESDHKKKHDVEPAIVVVQP